MTTPHRDSRATESASGHLAIDRAPRVQDRFAVRLRMIGYPVIIVLTSVAIWLGLSGNAVNIWGGSPVGLAGLVALAAFVELPILLRFLYRLKKWRVKNGLTKHQAWELQNYDPATDGPLSESDLPPREAPGKESK